jgi:type IV pilus assembly protein PilC
MGTLPWKRLLAQYLSLDRVTCPGVPLRPRFLPNQEWVYRGWRRLVQPPLKSISPVTDTFHMALDLNNFDQIPSADQKKTGSQSTENPVIGAFRAFLAMDIGSGGKVTTQDLVTFTSQLSLLLQNGNSLVPSIEALATQTGAPVMKTALTQVQGDLEQGLSLSKCFEQHPHIFDTFFVSIIRAGEASGALQEGLIRLGTILDIQASMKKKIGEAMTYPIVLTVIMGLVIVFMLTFMVPKFADIFAEIKDELPWSTNALIWLGAFMRSSWWIAIPIGVSAGIGIRKMAQSTKMRQLMDTMKMRLPFVKQLFMKSYMFQLFSSFSLLLSSRVPLLEAIEIARLAISNSKFEEFFDHLAEQVAAGNGMTKAFEECTFLPETVKIMVATGDASGALDQTMERLSNHYRLELESDIRKLGSLIEPVMLVVMGVVVGFIAVSFIVPMFKLSSVAH